MPRRRVESYRQAEDELREIQSKLDRQSRVLEATQARDVTPLFFHNAPFLCDLSATALHLSHPLPGTCPCLFQSAKVDAPRVCHD
jgi:hypothetical protein